MLACAGLLELRGSGLGLLKSTFGAENYMWKLSWSVFSCFGAIQFLRAKATTAFSAS